MIEFKVGDRVRFFQDLSEQHGIVATDVPLGTIGEVISAPSAKSIKKINEYLIKFPDGNDEWFLEDELELVDEEVDLPFNPISGITLTNVLDVSLEANQRLYLSALSGMVTARKQMADLTLDRYLPEAVRDALEDSLSKRLSELGEQAEDAVKRMSKILEVE